MSVYLKNSGVKRKFGMFTATSIVVANMIGAGIFTTTGLMAQHLSGPLWIMACWFAGGIIALSGALCYSELATRMPDDGGEFIYLKRLFHPVLGFLTGWTSFFVGFSAPIAGSALAFSEYFLAGQVWTESLFPGEKAMAVKALGILIILVFTGIHYLGVQTGSITQNILTVIKILIILGLGIAGLYLGGGDISKITLSVESGGTMALGTAMLLVMFSYSGWNASAYIAGEVKNPARTLPISLLTGTFIVMGLYLFLNFFILYMIPYGEVTGVIPVVGLASEKAFGAWAGRTLSILISLALLSSLSAYIIIGPRVYYAMAREGLFFNFASQIHKKFGVPGKAILLQGLVAVVMILAGTLEQLLVYIEFALGVFPLVAVAGIYLARKRKLGDDSAVKVWGYPFTPLFFLLTSLAILVIAFIDRPLESTIAIVTILAGIPLYFLIKGIRNPEQ
ncbi:MAG: APC family permease [Bacteroidales bacterium]